MKFYVPKEQKLKYTNYPSYTVDDYLLSYKNKLVAGKKVAYPFMQKMMDDRDATVSYYDAISLIFQIKDWQVTFDSEKPIATSPPPLVGKKTKDYIFKDCNYQVDPPENPDLLSLLQVLLRTLSDFSREINMREMVYMKSGMLPFIITSSTTPLFNSYYKVGSNATSVGVENISGLESIEYIKSRYCILLLCLMFDDRVDLLKDFQTNIKQYDDNFVSKVQAIVNKKNTPTKKKNDHLKEVNNYICEINKYILSVAQKYKDKLVRQIDIYYSIIVTASWSSFNILFQKEYICYLYDTMRNPQRKMEQNPLFDPIRFPINIISAKDMNDTAVDSIPKKIDEMNSLLNLNPKTEKSVKDYIYGSNNTILYRIDQNGDFTLTNTSIERINFKPDENDAKKEYLFAIIYIEKIFNFTQNT